MKKMTSKQIDRINELLIDNGKTLTAFYDEGFDTGFMNGVKNGVTVGLIGVAIGAVATLSIQGIRHLRKNNKEES